MDYFSRLSTFLKLFGAMGLTWFFEVIALLIMKTSDKPVPDALKCNFELAQRFPRIHHFLRFRNQKIRQDWTAKNLQVYKKSYSF